MKHTVPHDLEPAQARRVTEKALESYKERFSEYNPVVRWKTDEEAEVEFSAKGLSVTGNFRLLANAITIDMSVPFVLKLFQKKAVDVVEREINVWIAKAKAGELDDESPTRIA